ncbi:MAG TPA: hypothetical protein VE291_11250, partial [Terracidiphilus sp.]|nr:hypothetical protein [Terracidiphilus sp.]
MDALVTLSFRIQPLGTTSPDVLAITPALDGLLLTQLIEEFERAQGFEPAGGYEGIVPQNYRFGPLNRHFFVGPLDDDSQGDWHL